MGKAKPKKVKNGVEPHAREAHTERLEGNIKWFNGEKGYGFITPRKPGPDMFMHYSSLRDITLRDKLSEGTFVTYETGTNVKGICAQDVSLEEQYT